MSEVTVKELFGALDERRERIKALECESNSRAYQLRRCNEKKTALLEAVKYLLREYNQHVPEDTNCLSVRDAADVARAAIAKAEGGGA